MSFQAMTWAIGIELPAPKKALLLVMANYAGMHDCLWPLIRGVYGR